MAVKNPADVAKDLAEVSMLLRRILLVDDSIDHWRNDLKEAIEKLDADREVLIKRAKKKKKK